MVFRFSDKQSVIFVKILTIYGNHLVTVFENF